MGSDSAFWRYVVNAKRAEQAGQLAEARANLERAHRLAPDADKQIQVESWLAQLAAVPPPPFVLATDAAEIPARPRARKAKVKE